MNVLDLYEVGVKYETNKGEEMLSLIEDGLIRYSQFSFSSDLEGIEFDELTLIRYEDVLNEETGYLDHAVKMLWNGVVVADYASVRFTESHGTQTFENLVDQSVVTSKMIDECVLYICHEILKQSV